jgi:hypothetical protein
MSFFKKLGRGLKKAFRKGGAVSKFFKKGLPSGLEKVGGIANKVGRVAGKVSSICYACNWCGCS